jgi:predicted DNA-binding WGR domain protein
MVRAKAKSLAEKAGAIVTTSVSGQTDILIGPGHGLKFQNRPESAVVWSEQDFLKAVGGSSSSSQKKPTTRKKTNKKSKKKQSAKSHKGTGNWHVELVNQHGGSNKFYTLTLHGTELCSCYGAIGGTPRETCKIFSTRDEAQKEFKRLYRQKTGNVWGEEFVSVPGKYDLCD